MTHLFPSLQPKRNGGNVVNAHTHWSVSSRYFALSSMLLDSSTEGFWRLFFYVVYGIVTCCLIPFSLCLSCDWDRTHFVNRPDGPGHSIWFNNQHETFVDTQEKGYSFTAARWAFKPSRAQIGGTNSTTDCAESITLRFHFRPTVCVMFIWINGDYFPDFAHPSPLRIFQRPSRHDKFLPPLTFGPYFSADVMRKQDIDGFKRVMLRTCSRLESKDEDFCDSSSLFYSNLHITLVSSNRRDNNLRPRIGPVAQNNSDCIRVSFYWSFSPISRMKPS